MVHINCFRLRELCEKDWSCLLKRSETDLKGFMEKVSPIVEGVRERGDQALVAYTRQFDGVELPVDKIRVDTAEIRKAYGSLDNDVLNALRHAKANIEAYHQTQRPEPYRLLEIGPGIFAGERVVPIASVGLYVPRGKGAFPSVVLMTAVPASVAGVPCVQMVTPPGPDGTVDAACLVAADLCGVHEIFRVGGAQAIAALALGTETISPVAKIMGPGSPFIIAAKKLLSDVVDVGTPAGPSEALILADETADPHLVAADLLIESEHGRDSSAYLVTDSENLAGRVEGILPELLNRLPEWRREFCVTVLSGLGGIVIAEGMDQALEFVNRYAPEHLEILTRDPFETLHGITNAGEVMLGSHSPISIANYAIGLNAVLPTGGMARTHSALHTLDYMKRISVGYVTAQGYSRLEDAVLKLADYEGFAAHAQALRIRKERE
jgi:histidinol dehydrogenase